MLQKHNNDCGLYIKLIHDSIDKIMNKSLKEMNLTHSQLRFLIYMWERGIDKIPFKDFENHLSVSQPTVVGIINRLEAKGFVVSTTDTEDRRVKNASLSPKGLEQVQTSCLHRNAMESRLLKSLDQSEIINLRKTLKIMYANVK